MDIDRDVAGADRRVMAWCPTSVCGRLAHVRGWHVCQSRVQAWGSHQKLQLLAFQCMQSMFHTMPAASPRHGLLGQGIPSTQVHIFPARLMPSALCSKDEGTCEGAGRAPKVCGAICPPEHSRAGAAQAQVKQVPNVPPVALPGAVHVPDAEARVPGPKFCADGSWQISVGYRPQGCKEWCMLHMPE